MRFAIKPRPQRLRVIVIAYLVCGVVFTAWLNWTAYLKQAPSVISAVFDGPFNAALLVALGLFPILFWPLYLLDVLFG